MLASPFVLSTLVPDTQTQTHICAHIQAAFDHNCDTARREGGNTLIPVGIEDACKSK